MSPKRNSVFSLPVNPKLDKQFTDGIFIPWLTKYKDYIKDLYFTCRMPPFEQDAMGDTFMGDTSQLIFNALVISRETVYHCLLHLTTFMLDQIKKI